MLKVETLFKKHFGSTPTHVIRAPGRLELLGNHTDYNEGLVFAAAVDKYVELAVTPRADGRIALISSAFPAPEIFPANEFGKNPATTWADGVKDVLAQLHKRGVHFNGFSAAIHDGIPPGADLGGSTALAVATALAARQLYPFSLGEAGVAPPPKRDVHGKLPPLTRAEKMPLAKLCHAVANDFVGVSSRLLDPISSLFGKAWNVMEIDFRFLTVELAPLPGVAFVVCPSGNDSPVAADVRRRIPFPENAGCQEIREQCEAAARALGMKSLRAVDPKFLAANKSKLTPRQLECAGHVIGEIQRVVFAEKALREDDHHQFGQYMFQSHESSRDFLRNSTPDLDLLVDLARAIPGCLGARLTGCGSGGATVNLVAHHQAQKFMETIARQYEQRTGHKLEPILCQMADGAA